MLNRLVFLLGIRVNPEEEEYHSHYMLEFAAYLQNHYATTPLEEITAAHDLAVKGELPGVDDVYAMLSPVQFGKIMRAWQQYKNAQLEQLRRSQKLLPASEPPTPSQEEFDRNMIRLLRMALEVTKSGQEYIDYGNILYDFLDRLNMAEFTPQEKHQAIEQAREKLLHEAGARKTGDLLIDRSRMKALRDLISGAATPAGDDPRDPQVLIKWAKRILLNRLLSDITYEGPDETDDFITQIEEKVNQVNPSAIRKNHECINPDHYRRSA